MKRFRIRLTIPAPSSAAFHAYLRHEVDVEAESIHAALDELRKTWPERCIPAIHLKGCWEELP